MKTQPTPTIGRRYKHKIFGNITVTRCDPNDDKVCPFKIKFVSDFNTEYEQGINGFNFNVGITKTPWIA